MLGNTLKLLREGKGYTRKHVAELLQIDQTTYGKYELNKREPDIKTLNALANIYGVTVDYLINSKSEPDQNQDNTPAASIPANLSPSDQEKIDEEANRVRNLLMASLGVAFEGEIEDEETLEKVIAVLSKGLEMAKQDAKEKFTPKKYRQNKK